MGLGWLCFISHFDDYRHYRADYFARGDSRRNVKATKMPLIGGILFERSRRGSNAGPFAPQANALSTELRERAKAVKLLLPGSFGNAPKLLAISIRFQKYCNHSGLQIQGGEGGIRTLVRGKPPEPT
jgi:hypothetical protein